MLMLQQELCLCITLPTRTIRRSVMDIVNQDGLHLQVRQVDKKEFRGRAKQGPPTSFPATRDRDDNFLPVPGRCRQSSLLRVYKTRIVCMGTHTACDVGMGISSVPGFATPCNQDRSFPVQTYQHSFCSSCSNEYYLE